MRLILMHIADLAEGPRIPEEAALIVPGGERTALMVPLDALEDVIPEMLKALRDLPEQCCDCCGGPLACTPPVDIGGL
jgi:hypothetical protein